MQQLESVFDMLDVLGLNFLSTRENYIKLYTNYGDEVAKLIVNDEKYVLRFGTAIDSSSEFINLPTGGIRVKPKYKI